MKMLNNLNRAKIRVVGSIKTKATNVANKVLDTKLGKKSVKFIKRHHYYIPFILSLRSVVFADSGNKKHFNDDIFLDIVKGNLVSGVLLKTSQRMKWIESNVANYGYIGLELASMGTVIANRNQMNFVQKTFVLTKGTLCLSASGLQVLSNQLGYLPGITRHIKRPLDITCSALWGCYGIANQINIAANNVFGWNRYDLSNGSNNYTYGCFKVGCFGYGTGSTAPGYIPVQGPVPRLNGTDIM
jgi:hypothetical protein